MAMTWLQLLLFLNSLTVPLVPAPPLRLPLPLLIRIWAIVLLFSILRFIVLMTPTVNSSTTTLWMPTFPLLIVQMLPVLQPAELSLTLMAQPEPKLNLTLTAALVPATVRWFTPTVGLLLGIWFSLTVLPMRIVQPTLTRLLIPISVQLLVPNLSQLIAWGRTSTVSLF